MGLDMYLHKKTYVKNWEYMKEKDTHEVTVSRGGKIRTDIKPERISEIVEQVAYWRKANQIHSWFVHNVQNDVDNCGEYYVSIDQIKELVDLCKRILDFSETFEGKVTTGMQWSPSEGHRVIQEEGSVMTPPSIELAKKLLPSQEGCFFGSTDYNQFYLEDLRITIKQLEPLIEEIKGCDDCGSLYYHSSW
jgi:hypothetical protein